MAIKLNAKQLRKNDKFLSKDLKKQEIYLILEDVLDTYNIGSVFRLADAAAVRKIYLCGGTQTPPNPRIKKSSINTTEVVEWQYCESAKAAIEDLKKTVKNIQIVAIEQSKSSKPYNQFDYNFPLALLVGNESYGVLPSTLKKVDAIVELPMFGINVSLNVMVSLAIVVYRVLTTKN